MTRRILLIIGLAILFVVTVPAGILYYAACTEPGLQFIVGHIPKKIGRTELDFVNAHGTLSGGFKLERFELEHERVHLRFEGIEGHLTLLPLLWQTIHAEDISMRSARVEVRRWKTPPPKGSPRFLPPGLRLRVDQVHIGAGTLLAINGRQYDVTDLNTSGVLRYRTLRFFDVNFVQDATRVTAKAVLRAADPMQIDGDARLSIRYPAQPPWIIAVTGSGDLDVLGLTARFTSPLLANFTGKAEDLASNWHWSGKGRIQDLDLRTWGGGNALGRISGPLNVRGDPSGFALQGPLTPEGLHAGSFLTIFEGSYADRVITASRLDITHSSSRAHIAGTGDIGIVTNGPKLDLHGTWRDFRWPLVGSDISVRSASGEYALTGTWPYNVRATGMMAPADLAPMHVEMNGRLAKNLVTLDDVDVEAFEGMANLSGEVMWSPQERWKIMGDASDMNPGRLRGDLPGKLDFAFAASGLGFDKDHNFTVDIHGLNGRLRGTPASGSGLIAHRKNVWEFQQLRLALGGTKFSADGRIADAMDLRFAIDSDDLSLLSQESRGKLVANGILRGTLADPIIVAELHGGAMTHEGMTLDALNATVDFDSSGSRPSKVDIRARNFTYRERTLSDLALTLDGAAGNHVAHLDAKATGLAIQSELTGAFAHGAWLGKLNKLSVNGSEALHLELDTPVALALSGDHSRVDWFCLNGAPARVCADGEWTPAKWQATVNATGLPMRTLTSGLTPSVDYRGRLTVTARAFGGANERVQGNLRADLVDAAIAHKLASGKTERITLGTGLVTLDATDSMIDSAVTLDAGDIGTIKMKMDAQRSTDRWQDMPVVGAVHAQTAELGFISLYAPEVDRVSGKLMADLSISGTLGTPLLDGSFKLSDAELDLYQVNLAMRGTELEAHLLRNGLDFKGSSHVGPGLVNASGHLEWRDAQPYGKFRLEGENLRVVDVPEAQIDASPALDFKIDGRRIEVTGAVKVPYAKIVPADLTNAVRSSSDEVLVGQEREDPSKRFEVSTAIALTLGDKVSIDTLGLTARLTGTLALRSGTDEITRGSGELSVEEGKYAAYGRRLDIERGRLVFSGGPVNNPGVDIRAVKEYPDVKAGVNVRGTLLQPRLSFFSEPSLPQSQIVSLILAGGSFESAQNRNNPNQAGNEALAQGSAILAQQLGARVGIEDVSLESNLSNETSLVLGKYLSPRLYVSYGISFTEQLNTLKLRYSLTDRWTVKTEVGQARGADLVYTIEK
ncbi:MAG: translocation/assembly module TamB domain-containing protein [Gammaproteobacteria bacterium]